MVLRERGIALVTVLWVMAFLVVVAAAVGSQARNETYLARNLVDSAQARQLAEGGIYLVIHDLLTRPAGQGRAATGATRYRLEDGEVALVVQDEAGKIDLNAAPRELLLGLLKAAGMNALEGDRLADAILDWRDTDSLRRLNGAEDRDYRAAGLDHGAKDGPFDTVEELRGVLGMSEALFEEIRPALTVHTGRAQIDPAVAPELALRAVPGLSPSQVAHYKLLRQQGESQGRPLPPPPPLGPRGKRFLAPHSGGLYAITARAALDTGMSAYIRAIVQLQARDPREPFSVLEWRTGPGIVAVRPEAAWLSVGEEGP